MKPVILRIYQIIVYQKLRLTPIIIRFVVFVTKANCSTSELMEQIKQHIAVQSGEDIKGKLIELCNSDDESIQKALQILFPPKDAKDVPKVPPPPPPPITLNSPRKPVVSRARAKGIYDVTPFPQDNTRKTRSLTIDEENPVSFKYILQEPTLCQGFKKHLEKQFCEENLLFVQNITLFRETVKSFPPEKQFK